MKRVLLKGNWLIVIGLFVIVTGCSNLPEVAVPAEGVKTGPLERAIAIFQKAEGLGAVGAAPKSYKKTRQALNDVNAVIKRDPDNEQAIQNALDYFAFEAEHLEHITNEVKELRSINSQALENVVLSAEYRLLAISDALKQPDPRRQKLYDQSVTIANVARQQATSQAQNSVASARPVNKNELDEAQARIQQLQVQLKGMQDDNDQLKRDQQPLNVRIDSLERLVVNLNADKTELEANVKELKAKLNKPKPK